MAMRYSELEADRDLLGRVMRRLEKDKGIDVFAAIDLIGKASDRAAVEHGLSASADGVLQLCGASFRVSDVAALRDQDARTLEHTVETRRPHGEVDETGRVRMSNADAAKLLTSDEHATAKWLEAKQAGLNPGLRDEWIADARMLAQCNVDMLGTALLEKHDSEVKIALARGEGEARTLETRPKSRYEVAFADSIRHLEDARRAHDEWPEPAPEPQQAPKAPREGRVIQLDAAGVPCMWQGPPMPLGNIDGQPLPVA